MRKFIDVDMLEIDKPFVTRLEGCKCVTYNRFSVEGVDRIDVIKRFHKEGSYFYLVFYLHRNGERLADFVTDIREIVQVEDLGSMCFIC